MVGPLNLSLKQRDIQQLFADFFFVCVFPYIELDFCKCHGFPGYVLK